MALARAGARWMPRVGRQNALRLLSRPESSALLFRGLKTSAAKRVDDSTQWFYRDEPDGPETEWQKDLMLQRKIVMSIVWWWIFFNLFTDGVGHIIGHHHPIPVDSLTDEELGIPPDAADA